MNGELSAAELRDKLAGRSSETPAPDDKDVATENNSRNVPDSKLAPDDRTI